MPFLVGAYLAGIPFGFVAIVVTQVGRWPLRMLVVRAAIVGVLWPAVAALSLLVQFVGWQDYRGRHL